MGERDANAEDECQESCCVIHISNLVLRAFLKSQTKKRQCRMELSERGDLSKCLRELRVLVVHKREVASYRGSRQATGS